MHITESGRFCQTSRFRFERIRSCRCLNSLVGENAAFDRTEHFNTAHVRTKRFGNRHAAVSVLVVFEHGDERAADGEAGTVERVDVLGLAIFILEASAHAAGLEGLAVGAGRNLAVGVLRGDPDFKVCLLYTSSPAL